MLVDVEVNEREEIPSWLAYGTPVFTILAALLVGAVAILAVGESPIVAYDQMFVHTLTEMRNLSEVMVRAAPLILAGLAVYLPMKAGLWNIGAEGQLIAGAVAGTLVGLNVSLPQYALLPLMILAAGFAGACWGFIPAWLRAKWGINEIITTLLFTFIAIELQLYLVRGHMQGGFGGFPQTDRLSEAALLPSFTGFDIPSSIFLALLVVAGVYVLMEYTRLGFQITFVGSNDEAAEQAGMSKFKIVLFTLVVGGAFAALAGISEIAGNRGRLQASFEPGYGFTAIPIALLGRNGAFKVLLAALFFALLFVGGDSVSVAMDVPFALIEIIQALIILFLITAEFFKSYSIDISVGRAGSDPTEPAEVTAND